MAAAIFRDEAGALFVQECWLQEKMQPDAKNGVLREVKICGNKSKNRREYSDPVLTAAIPLYQGAKANVGHPRGENPFEARHYGDRLGRFEGPRVREGAGLFGDLHFNPKHKLAEQLLWDAEHSPESVGFSHNVLARMDFKDDWAIVQEITRVISVDLEADPGSVRGLFENEELRMSKLIKQTIKAIIAGAAPAEFAAYEAVATANGIDLAREFEVAEAAKPLDRCVAVLEALGAEAMRDTTNAAGARAERFRVLAQMADDVRKGVRPAAEAYRTPSAGAAAVTSAANAAAVAGTLDPNVAALTESVKTLSGRIDSMATLLEKSGNREIARQVLEAHGVPQTVALLETLSAMPTREKMELFIWTSGLNQPENRHLAESFEPNGHGYSGGKYEAPKDGKELAARIAG